MPAEVRTQTKINYISQRRITPCGTTLTMASATTKDERVKKNDPIRRPKPDESNLFRSLTLLPMQYTDVLTSRQEKRLTPLILTCPGQGKVTGWLEETYWQPTSRNFPPAEATNWQMAMGAKFQEDVEDYSEAIGEWRETVKALGMGARICKKAYNLAWKLARARSPKGWRALMKEIKGWKTSDFKVVDVAAAHLAIKFGILPVLGQVYDGCERLSRVSSTLKRHQVTLTTKSEIRKAGVTSGAATWKLTRSQRAIAYVRYDPNVGDFTAGNPAQSFWAGVPLSFVVDWFLDVGGYLASWNAMRGVVEVHGVLCTRDRYTMVDDRCGLYRGDKVSTWCSVPGTWEREEYSRSTFNGLPAALFPNFRLPDSDLWSRMLSLAEIMTVLRGARAHNKVWYSD